jgi:hypothetical protein
VRSIMIATRKPGAIAAARTWRRDAIPMFTGARHAD